MISTRFCRICGASNTLTDAHCFACGLPLTVEEEATTAGEKGLLHERYKLGVVLGSGGYSAVYRAVDIREAQGTVAIKQINLQGLGAEEAIERTSCQ